MHRNKIIFLSDLHLAAAGGDLCGLNPLMRLRAAVEDINAHHADADMVIVLGDIANQGDIASYKLAAREFARLPIPFYLLPGNHDHRDNMRRVFRGLPEGFMQQVIPLPGGGACVLLDTVRKGEDGDDGKFCARRGRWLAQVLRAATQPVLLAMHHPPLHLHLPADDIKITNTQHFTAAVESAPNKICFIICGHVHASTSGVWRGIPFTTLRSTMHQTFFATESPATEIYTHAAPHYGALFADDTSVVLHHHSFLENTPAGRYDGTAV